MSLLCAESHRCAPPIAHPAKRVAITKIHIDFRKGVPIIRARPTNERVDDDLVSRPSGTPGQSNYSPIDRCRFRRAVSAPINHKPPPLLEQVTPSVSRLDLVVNDMRQRHLDNVVGVACGFCRPVSEGRAEAVNRNAIMTHSSEHARHRHVRKASPARANEYKRILSFPWKALEKFDSTGRERYPVLAPTFDPLRWHGPDPLCQVNLVPRRADHFAPPRPGQNC